MPTLISNHQKKVFAVRAKKAYSVISQAIKLYEAKEESPGDVTGLFDTSKTSVEVTDAFSQYFQTVSKCFENNSKCKYLIKYTTPIYDENNKAMQGIMGNADYPYFILNDGTFISVRQRNQCEWEVENNEFNEDGTIKRDDAGNPIVVNQKFYYCAEIRFDTNGQQGPNQAGMDIFELRVSPDGRYAQGWDKMGWENLINILNGNDFAVSKYNYGDEKK